MKCLFAKKFSLHPSLKIMYNITIIDKLYVLLAYTLYTVSYFKQTTQESLDVGVAQKNCSNNSCPAQYEPPSRNNKFDLDIDLQGYLKVRVSF